MHIKQDPTATITISTGSVITDGTATITKRKGPPSGGATSSHKLDDIRKRLDRLKGGQQ